MCASYGLEIKGSDLPTANDRLVTAELVAWMRDNAGATIRPTGPKARNLNPIVTPAGFEESWWGMWDKGAPMKYGINATAEKLTRWPWGTAFASGRVLVPMSEYYEYRPEGGRNVRYAFHVDGAPLFAIAGIAAPLNPPPPAELSLFDDETPAYPASSYALVTREPTDAAREIHDRMLLLLPPSFYDDWLDPGNAGDDTLRAAALAASDEIVEQLVVRAA